MTKLGHRNGPGAGGAKANLPRVVYDPTGDFAGVLSHVATTLKLGYFPPGLILAWHGKQYTVRGPEGGEQRLVRCWQWRKTEDRRGVPSAR